MRTDLVTASPIGLDDSYRWPHAERLLPGPDAVAAVLGPDPEPEAAVLTTEGGARGALAGYRPGARAALRAVSCAALAAAAWMAAWSVFPRALGWQPVLVVGGSMAPRIERGDVVLVRPAPASALTPGAVITFVDAGRHGELVTHRVVAVLADGRLRTRGDHNSDDDPQPVPYTAVRGRAVLRLPWVGRPAIWVRDRRWSPLAVLAATTAVLVAAAGARPTRATRHPAASGLPTVSAPPVSTSRSCCR